MTLHLLAILRRRWFALVLCLGLGVAGAVVTTIQTPRTYKATDTLIVNIPQASNPGEALQGVQLSSQLLASYAQVATSRTAAQKIRDHLALPDSVESIQGKISAAPVPETLLLTVSATDTDPVRAASLADEAAGVFIESVGELEAGKQDRVQPKIIDPAQVPTQPISPRPKLNLFFGLFTGLLAGGALSLILDALDRSVNGPAQLADLVERPLLGVIPKLTGASRYPAATLDDPLTPGSESFRALRTAIRFLDPDNPPRTILVVSPAPGEGKSTVSAHLAVTLAQGGERVVLVDGDLRRGTMFELLGLPEGAGLTSVITRQATLDEVLYEWRETLLALGTGPFPPNPSEILGSQAMAQLLDDLAEIAEVVVIDGPPILPVTDSVALSTQVDAVVLVARDGKTQRHSLVEARRRLDNVGATVVGAVLNAERKRRDSYSEYNYLAPRPTRSRRSLGRRAG